MPAGIQKISDLEFDPVEPALDPPCTHQENMPPISLFPSIRVITLGLFNNRVSFQGACHRGIRMPCYSRWRIALI